MYNLIQRMPPSIRKRLPEDLKHKLDHVMPEDTDDPELLIQILVASAQNTPKPPTQDEYDKAKEVSANVCSFLEEAVPRIRLVKQAEAKQLDDIFLSLYQACQAFCVEYNKVNV